ncbi:MAG: MerR family transcriptional regulator [Pseudomonadota bacterium]
MYRIGEFSRITSLTVKALRLYHDKGIIVPSVVDRATGYRYYSVKDVEKANAVSALKSMRCSLSEIKQLMSDYSDDADLVDFLKNKREALQHELDQLSAVSFAIETIVNNEIGAERMKQQSSEIEIKTIGDQVIVSNRWHGAYADSGKQLGRLYRVAGRQVAGAAINLFYDGEYRESGADVESCLPLKKPITGKATSTTLKGGRFATLTHRGPYDTISSSYALLFEHINQQGAEPGLPTREVYHKGPGMIFKGNPKRYLTEIQIPIS